MKYLLNSAVITSPGTYQYRIISLDEAKRWLEDGDWESTIGYAETAEALEVLTGVPIPVNRRMIRMEHGDEALIFRLTIRLNDPAVKGKLTPEFVLEHSEIGMLAKIKPY